MQKEEIEQRVELARKAHAQGYNCAESVVLAYADCVGLDKNVAEKMSVSFGGGVAKMREICGCVSAMAMLAGFIKENQDENSRPDTEKCYQWTKCLADKFRSECGDIVCKRLRGIEKGCTKPPMPCREFVATMARLIGENLA
ncbi:MAG: C-GCAxxG-C-C family protein [Candidatus Onthomorpha sp.]|nr:C-GCAxxG-C-C family protein [Candidatus Onthomorpha sp.]